MSKTKEEKVNFIFGSCRTIRHLFRALNNTNDDVKWKDLAKVISIDANELSEAIIEYLEVEAHEREKIKLEKAANNTLISLNYVEKTRKIYDKIIKVTITHSDDVQSIIEALVNAIMFYIFSSRPKIKLSVLRGAITVLYNDWENKIKNNGNMFN